MAVNGAVIALDIGARRVGVARASLDARLPEPLITLINDETIWEKLSAICAEQQASQIVVGLPRGLDGQLTDQTKLTKKFAAELEKRLKLTINFQDEALTSKKAEAELIARKKTYQKADIDALAATYILEDFLSGENAKIR